MEIPFARDGGHVSCSSSSGCEEVVLHSVHSQVSSLLCPALAGMGQLQLDGQSGQAGTLTSLFCDLSKQASKLSLSSLRLEGCAHVRPQASMAATLLLRVGWLNLPSTIDASRSSPSRQCCPNARMGHPRRIRCSVHWDCVHYYGICFALKLLLAIIPQATNTSMLR